MKLASLDDGSRDGRLLVVARDLGRAVDASGIAATLQLALEHWPQVEARLQALYQRLNDNQVAEAFDLDPTRLAAPLPRASQWLDGSCFLSHGELMQKAFNLEPIEGVEHTPLIYQGASDDFLGARADIRCPAKHTVSISRVSLPCCSMMCPWAAPPSRPCSMCAWCCNSTMSACVRWHRGK